MPDGVARRVGAESSGPHAVVPDGLARKTLSRFRSELIGPRAVGASPLGIIAKAKENRCLRSSCITLTNSSEAHASSANSSTVALPLSVTRSQGLCALPSTRLPRAFLWTFDTNCLCRRGHRRGLSFSRARQSGRRKRAEPARAYRCSPPWRHRPRTCGTGN